MEKGHFWAYLIFLLFKITNEDTMTIRIRHERDAVLNLSQSAFSNATEIFISLDNSVVLGQPIDLGAESFPNSVISIYLVFLKGFVASMRASPFILLPDSWHYDIFFEYSSLIYYDTKHKALGPSCDAFMASYFELDINSVLNGTFNKSLLFQQIEVSTFSFKISSLIFMETAEYMSSICPLMFKNSNITYMEWVGLQSNRIVQHMPEFSDLKDTFNMSQELDLNCEIRILQLSEIYRTDIGTRNLNSNVFFKTKLIFISGVLNSFKETMMDIDRVQYVRAV